MTEPARMPGLARTEISTAMVGLFSEYYGRGPTRARTYINDDIVAVVLEETFTRAEQTLVERGEVEAIQHVRRRFQQQMRDEFTAVVEQSTGRKVRVFLSQTSLDPDISVELFLLAEEGASGARS
jgi:uncharacterized protein YbcI